MRILFIVFIGILLSCANKKPVAQESKSAEPVKEKKAVNDSPAKEVIQKESRTFSLQRTACYGQCPTYTIIVKEDGSALYNGINFVQKKGVFKSQVSAEDVDKIFTEAEKIDFFNLEDKYDEPITDIPSTIVIMSKGKLQKRVIDRSGGPAELEAFEKFLEKKLMALPWEAAPEISPNEVQTNFD
jgi:hypothetical protein